MSRYETYLSTYLAWLVWGVSPCFGAAIPSPKPISVRSGFITRAHCEGRLLAAATGNPALLHIEPVPKEMGCAVLLKAEHAPGRTDLILETTAGTSHHWVEIIAAPPTRLSDLEVDAQGEDP